MIYANGERHSMGALEAIQEATTRLDIVGVEGESGTGRSLFQAIIEAGAEGLEDVVE